MWILMNDQMLEGLTILDQHKDHFNVHKICDCFASPVVLYNRLKNLVLPYRPIRSK